MNRYLPDQFIAIIADLVDATYTSRDELHAAADCVDDVNRRAICRELADHLANHAIDLHQLLVINGVSHDTPIDMHSLVEPLFDELKRRRGEMAVIQAAEKCERHLREHCDRAIAAIRQTDGDTAAILERHRRSIEFGELVLGSIRPESRHECHSE